MLANGATAGNDVGGDSKLIHLPRTKRPAFRRRYSPMPPSNRVSWHETSSNRNIFRVTGHLCGEFSGHWWIPCPKAGDAELKGFLWSAPGWAVNNGDADDLRRHRVHHVVIVMDLTFVPGGIHNIHMLGLGCWDYGQPIPKTTRTQDN